LDGEENQFAAEAVADGPIPKNTETEILYVRSALIEISLRNGHLKFGVASLFTRTAFIVHLLVTIVRHPEISSVK